MEYSGNIVDIVKKRIFKGTVIIEDDLIIDILEKDNNIDNFILPGFIDSHVHIESSLLIPFEFARLAVRCGTVAVVADPHEIANVLGEKGVRFMFKNAEISKIKFYFGVPSCVPATNLEMSGGVLKSETIDKLLSEDKFYCLSEMMNIPGVVYSDADVLAKLKSAEKYSKPIDGHAPTLTGNILKKYVDAGISTDHESSTYEEAKEKIDLGMNILIREGSAAKDFKALSKLINEFPDKIMFCTDDLHPDDLLKAHINKHVSTSISDGNELFNTLRAASYNPVIHYKLDVGLLQNGDKADFIVVDNLSDFNILETIINGNVVYSSKKEDSISHSFLLNDTFNCKEINILDLKVEAKSDLINVISVTNGELYTKHEILKVDISSGFIRSDVDNDILKLVLLNRYNLEAKPVVAFIKGFGMKCGCFAQSIAHDNHYIIAVGVNDEDIVDSINKIFKKKGGISVKGRVGEGFLHLPIAGLMSDKMAEDVAFEYENLNILAITTGSSLTSPLMTLSFMALIVIPDLKLGEHGLFSYKDFNFVSLFA